MRIFYTGQEVKVNNRFYAIIIGKANYEGTIVSLKRVLPSGKIERGHCGTKGIEMGNEK